MLLCCIYGPLHKHGRIQVLCVSNYGILVTRLTRWVFLKVKFASCGQTKLQLKLSLSGMVECVRVRAHEENEFSYPLEKQREW